MSRTVEIISKGRCVKVSELELGELRVADVSWYAYSQSRLKNSHGDAVTQLTAKKSEFSKPPVLVQGIRANTISGDS